MSLSPPEATYGDDVYRFEWPDIEISVMVERLFEDRGDIRCELTVTSANPLTAGQLYFGRLLLMGPNSRREVMRSLVGRDETIDWQGVLEYVCTLALRRYRAGVPLVNLASGEFGDGTRFLVAPYVYEDCLNMIYGLGDSGKSLMALAVMLAVATGHEVGDLLAERTGGVLFLDWEVSGGANQERLLALATAHGIDLGESRILYRRMTTSLSASAREIRRDIAAHGVVLVVVDSFGMACGGDPSDATAVIETMLAARSLGVAVLAIHHIAKGVKDKSTPYGSVYASNEARNTYYVEAERQGDQLTQTFTNYKNNNGRRQPKRSYRFDFVVDERERPISITMRSLDNGSTEARRVGDSGVRYRIAECLTKLGPLTATAIAEAVDATKDTTNRTLNRYRGTWFTRLDDGRWAAFEASRQSDRTVGGHTSSVFGVGQDTPPPIRGVSQLSESSWEGYGGGKTIDWEKGDPF